MYKLNENFLGINTGKDSSSGFNHIKPLPLSLSYRDGLWSLAIRRTHVIYASGEGENSTDEITFDQGKQRKKAGAGAWVHYLY